MRVAAQMPAVEADHLHQLGHHLATIGIVADTVDDQRFDQDVVDGHARVERAERILEDELQLGAEAVELRALEAHHVDLAAPVVEDHAAALAGVGGDAAHQHLAQRGLATARFAHQAQALAAHDVEADVVDGVDGARRAAPHQLFHQRIGLADAEGLGDVAHLQHRRVGIEGRGRRGNLLLLQEMAGRALDLADRLEALAGLHVEARHRVQQSLQVGVLRIAEDVVQVACFDDLAAIHDDHVVGDVGDHPEIVGDHQQRHPEFLLQVLHEAQDLGLDGDVERGRRLVGDQQRRPADQGHGDHGALAQAAGQFEGISPERPLGIGKAHHAQHVHREPVDLGAAELAPGLAAQRTAGLPAVQLDSLADLVAHRVEGRQRGHRFLEDDRDLAAADTSHGRAGAVDAGDVDDALVDARVLEQDRAGGDGRGARQQAHDRLAADRLARARLAHQGHRAAGRNGERHLVDGAQHAFVDAELDRQILDSQQIVHTVSS